VGPKPTPFVGLVSGNRLLSVEVSSAGPVACENRRLRTNRLPMDIERINSIGTLLADLSARTEQLRGYL
jgi:hypothetical protein